MIKVRSHGGVYLLSEKSGSVAVNEVITTVNESVDDTKCRGEKGCQSGTLFLTHVLWCDFTVCISEVLNNITVAELVNNQQILYVAYR